MRSCSLSSSARSSRRTGGVLVLCPNPLKTARQLENSHSVSSVLFSVPKVASESDCPKPWLSLRLILNFSVWVHCCRQFHFFFIWLIRARPKFLVFPLHRLVLVIQRTEKAM